MPQYNKTEQHPYNKTTQDHNVSIGNLTNMKYETNFMLDVNELKYNTRRSIHKIASTTHYST